MTMKTNELRVDKLRTKKALDFYRDVVYPRHLNSFPLFGIEAHRAGHSATPWFCATHLYALGDSAFT
jgi:hypothetical protein